MEELTVEEKDAVAEAITETMRIFKRDLANPNFMPNLKFIEDLETGANELDLGTKFDLKTNDPDGT